MILAGTVLGAVVGTAGAIGVALAPALQAPMAFMLGAIALVYALSEVGLISLPVPGRNWQVPADWVRNGFYRSAMIFGGTVGFGIFTRIPYASFPIMVAWMFVSGNVLYAALAGTVYGVARAISIYSSSSLTDIEGLVGLNQRIMSMIPTVHKLTGVALAAFAAYLLVATVIS